MRIKKVIRSIVWVILAFVGLGVLLSVAVYLPPVQKWISGKIVSFVSGQYGIDLKVGHIAVLFPDDISLTDVVLFDRQHDTMIYAGHVSCNIAVTALLNRNVHVSDLTLDDAGFHLLRLEAGLPLNIEVFTTADTAAQAPVPDKPEDASAGWAITLARVNINHGNFRMHDVRQGMLLDIGLGEIKIRHASLKLAAQQIPAKEVYMGDSYIRISMFPPVPYPEEKDTAVSRWLIDLGKLTVDRSSFSMNDQVASSAMDIGLGHVDLSAGVIDLGRSEVKVKNLDLDKGSFVMKTSARQQAPQQEQPSATGDTAQNSWLIEVEKLALTAGMFGMETEGTPVVDGFDPNHLSLTDINASIDHFVNYGLVIKGGISNLHLRHPSGFSVGRLDVGLDLDSAFTKLDNLVLQMPGSRISMGVDIPVPWYDIAGFLKQDLPVSGYLDASIAINDLTTLFPDSALLPFAGQTVMIGTSLSGTSRKISLDRLAASLPGVVRMSAQGKVNIDPDRLVAGHTEAATISKVKGYLSVIRRMNLDLAVTTGDLGVFLPPPDTAQVFNVPEPVRINMNVQSDSGVFRLASDVSSEHGQIDLDGSLNTATDHYRFVLATDSFLLSGILPGMKLGKLIVHAHAEGDGLDAESLSAVFGLRLGLLEYAGYAYRDITLEGTAGSGHADARLHSGNEALKLDLGISGQYIKRPAVAVKGDIDFIDLYQLGFTDTGLSFGTRIEATLVGTPADSLDAHASIAGTSIQMGKSLYHIRELSADAHTDSSITSCRLVSGDMTFDMDIFAGGDQIDKSIKAIGIHLPRQIADGSFAFLVQPDTLPYFKVSMSSGRNNVLTDLMANDSISFESVALSCVHDENTLFNLNADVIAFEFGSNYVDSIHLEAKEADQQLKYMLRAGTISGQFRNLHRIRLNGSVAPHDLGIHLNVKTPSGRPFIDVGLQTDLYDTLMTVRINTPHPVFGTGWQVNPQNYFTYRKQDGFFADLQLTREDEQVIITNSTDPRIKKGAVSLVMKNIDLGAITGFVPIAPPVSGILDTELLFVLRNKFQGVMGTLDIRGMAYNKRIIGDTGLDIYYLLNEGTEHRMHGDIKLNGRKTAWVNGSFSTQNADSMKFEAGIDTLELSLVEVFAGEVISNTQGTLDMKASLAGSVKKPNIDGQIKINGFSAKVIPSNIAYSLPPVHTVDIKNGVVAFNRLSLSDPNNKEMVLDGTIDLTAPGGLITDISLDADGFQLVDAPKADDALYYGQAFASISTTVKGDIAHPVIRGKLSVLDGTKLTYIPQSSIDVKEQSKTDVVRFRMSVADSIHQAHLQPQSSAFDDLNMSMNLNISESATFVVGLSSDLSNYVSIQGGGNLVYTLTPGGYQNMTGKYEIKSGQVAYHPPAISEKIFDVSAGSYVNWNGDMMNPEINITAVQRVRLNVVEGESSRLVFFDISIMLQNTLESLDIKLDLKANDATIQSQLARATPEEITMLAMNVLIYNTYTPPGTSSETTAGGGDLAMDALNSLISKQLNSWAQNNIKGATLTFNVESYTQYDGGDKVQQTDFAYQFSKKILNDRGTIRIGGHMGVSDPNQSAASSLVDDLVFEYMLDDRERKFLKVFQQRDYQDILESDVTKMGVGIVFRKQLDRLRNLFRIDKKNEK